MTTFLEFSLGRSFYRRRRTIWELFGHTYIALVHFLRDGDELDKRCFYVGLLSVKIVYYLKLKKNILCDMIILYTIIMCALMMSINNGFISKSLYALVSLYTID